VTVGRIRTVYEFKVRQFFGPVFRSAATIAFLGLAGLVTLPSVLVAGFFLPDTPLWRSTELAGLFGAGLSAFLAFDLLFAVSGGTLTHPAEIDFFTTAPLRPRQYLAADLLFQFTVTDALAIPVLGLGAIGLGLRTGNWAGIFSSIVVFLLFAAMGLVLGQAMGLAVAAGKRGAKSVLVAMVIVLLLPSARWYSPLVPGYAQVPFPSTAAAGVIAGSLFGGDVLGQAVEFALFGVAILVVWIVQSGRDIFPNLRPTMRVAFGQADLRKVAMRQEALTRGLGRLTRRVTVDLMKGAPIAMMTRFHLMRILRDGSILMVGLLTGILVVIGAANRVSSDSPSDFSAFTTGWTALMIPVILSFNWNATERANLWTVAMAPKYLGTYFRGFYRAAAVVTLVASVVGALAGNAGSPIGVVASILMAFAACGTAVTVVAAVKIPTDAFSLKSVLPFLVVPPVALAVGGPAIAVAIFAGSLGLIAWPLVIAYAVLILYLFDRLPRRAALRFEL